MTHAHPRIFHGSAGLQLHGSASYSTARYRGTAGPQRQVHRPTDPPLHGSVGCRSSTPQYRQPRYRHPRLREQPQYRAAPSVCRSAAALSAVPRSCGPVAVYSRLCRPVAWPQVRGTADAAVQHHSAVAATNSRACGGHSYVPTVRVALASQPVYL